jgi:hypothetical protein
LQRVQDNAYLFMLSRENLGRVIIDRSSRECRERDNVFDALNIDREELDFLIDKLFRGESSPIAILSRVDGEERVTLFMGALSRFTSICLCIELGTSACAAAKVICQGSVAGVVASDGVYGLAQADCSKEQLEQAYRYIMRVLEGVGELCSLKSTRESVNVHEICRLAYAAADFIGISLDANAFCIGEPKIESGTVFAGGFCASMILFCEMLARKYSNKRELFMTVSDDCGGIHIALSFEGDGVPDGVIASTLEKIECHGVAVSCRSHEGVYYFEAVPQYEDVGLVGLKAHDDIF